MKILLVFFIYTTVCNGENVDNGKVYNSDYDEEYIGNPDDYAIIERPCQVYDIYCIRKYFANNAKCTLAKGLLPDPLYRTQSNYYIPALNLTTILTEVMMTGLNNTRIEEFYINRKTNKLVIAIEFRQLAINIPNTYIVYYRRAREPITTLTDVGVIFSFTVTAIIPNAKNLQLDKAEVTSFNQNALPVFFLTPTVAIPPDPQVLSSITSLPTNVATAVQEVFITGAFYYASIYIQSNICDFGLKVI